jgi:hypothetical protein
LGILNVTTTTAHNTHVYHVIFWPFALAALFVIVNVGLKYSLPSEIPCVDAETSCVDKVLCVDARNIQCASQSDLSTCSHWSRQQYGQGVIKGFSTDLSCTTARPAQTFAAMLIILQWIATSWANELLVRRLTSVCRSPKAGLDKCFSGEPLLDLLRLPTLLFNKV